MVNALKRLTRKRYRMGKNLVLSALAVPLIILLSGCVSFPDAPQAIVAPVLENGMVRSIDGVDLHADFYEASEEKAVILALHGMNDYAGFYKEAGVDWAAAGITVIALDQRGFGRNKDAGIWPGGDTLRADLRASIDAIRVSRPQTPLYVVGHSMGGAVVLSAMAARPLDVDGVILAAPAIWGGPKLPLPYRAAANIAAFWAPNKTLTGERAARQATDNIAVLRAMSADPLLIKETTTRSILGVVRLMGEAWNATGDIAPSATVSTATDQSGPRVLYLIGEKDEIIPVKLLTKGANRLTGDIEVRRYPNGWHLLFRDLDGAEVRQDVIDWIME